jgi:hypothetical protein
MPVMRTPRSEQAAMLDRPKSFSGVTAVEDSLIEPLAARARNWPRP